MKGTEYRGVTSVDGPIVVLKRTENVFYNETVCVRDRFGEKRIGKIVDISQDAVVVQIFGSTVGLELDDVTFEFLDEPLELRVGEGLLGRVFNGLGEPSDGYPQIISSEKRNVNGNPMNKVSSESMKVVVRLSYILSLFKLQNYLDGKNINNIGFVIFTI